MNAKFNMPKFRRELTGKGWLKELLMTFLGTTIFYFREIETAPSATYLWYLQPQVYNDTVKRFEEFINKK